jgi:hypothetical protein
MKTVILIILVFYFAPTSAQIQLAGVWEFNGDANNAAGNGANGVVYNATLTTGRSGIPFTAYQFNGINSHIDIPFDTLWNMKKWTIQTAVRIDGFNPDTCQEEYIVSYGAQATGNFYGVGLTDNVHDNSCTTYSPNNTEFTAAAAGGAATVWHDGSYIQLHQWYCLTFTYDGSNIKRYVNSTFVDSLPWTNQYNYSNTQSPLVFGYNPGSTGNHQNWLNGAIDIVTIYNTNIPSVAINSYNCNVSILSINSSFFNTVICAGATDSLLYYVNLGNIIFPGNIFTVQLSDSSGSFANPLNIGSSTSIVTSGIINYTIPLSTPAGSEYRIRLVSSNKPITGEPEQYPIRIIPSLPPSVYISSNISDTICAHTPVTFTAHFTNNGSIQHYQWKKNGVAVGQNAAIYTDSLLANGDVITFTLISTNVCGIGTTVSNSILIKVNPLISLYININVNPTAPVCKGTSITFTVPCNVPGYIYQWSINGNFIPNLFSCSFNANYLNSGDVIICTITNGQPCTIGISLPAIFTINPSPDTAIVASGPIHVCLGDSITLNAPIGNIYQWQLNGVEIAGATTSTYTIHATGNYTVFITNSYNCSVTSKTVAATVLPKPTGAIANVGGFLQICTNDSLQLAASFGNTQGYTYQWMWNGNDLSNATSYKYTTTTAGNYALTIINNGCTVTSNTLAVTTIAAPTDTLLNTTQGIICPGGPGIALNGGTPGSTETYQWYRNGQPVAGATSVNYTAMLPSAYTLKIKDNNNGCYSFSEQAIITKGFLPTPVITYQWPSFKTGVFSTYQWYYSGAVIVNATSASYRPTQTGVYSVLVTDANGCSGISENFYFAYSSITNTLLTGSEIKVYPNPTNTIVHIDAALPVNVTLYAIDGRKVMSRNSVQELDVSGLANGLYVLSLFDENGRVMKVEKLVKY